MDPTGRIALVTGGSRRVGRAIVQALAAAGADVVIHHRDSAPDAEAGAAEVRAAGRRAAVVAGDLSTPEGTDALADAAERALGPIGILVNNAAIWPRTPLGEVTPEDWRACLRINLVAPARLAMRFGLVMARTSGGAIVNVTDWAAERPYTDYLPYLVSKGGLVTATRALARELAPRVRVNAVAPGPVLPPADLGPAALAGIVADTPLGRIGRPQDVAAAVVYLVCADYVTGTVLPVDGGRTLVGPGPD